LVRYSSAVSHLNKLQGQQDDNFTPLVEVFLKGMLESFAYIRLGMDPNINTMTEGETTEDYT